MFKHNTVLWSSGFPCHIMHCLAVTIPISNCFMVHHNSSSIFRSKSWLILGFPWIGFWPQSDSGWCWLSLNTHKSLLIWGVYNSAHLCFFWQVFRDASRLRQKVVRLLIPLIQYKNLFGLQSFDGYFSARFPLEPVSLFSQSANQQPTWRIDKTTYVLLAVSSIKFLFNCQGRQSTSQSCPGVQQGQARFKAMGGK